MAEYLTEFELQRTQTEFDDSLTLKIYLLQFINYYASIFYIAFFKGKVIGTPKRYNKIFGYRQEEVSMYNNLYKLILTLLLVWSRWLPFGALHPIGYYYGWKASHEHSFGNDISTFFQMDEHS